MKSIDLHQFLNVIGVDSAPYPNMTIYQTENNIKRLKDNSIVFHLNKTTKLNLKRFKKLSHCYIVTDQPLLKTQGLSAKSFIFVKNVERAFETWIEYYRNQFDIPVVAITGTCGKTTTKEMVKQILAHDHKVIGTIRSKNNLRFNHGYLMEMEEDTEVAVFETAMTHPGNLITESLYFKPTIGLITTIGIDHLNHMKTMDNYIRAKGEMMAALNYQGILILNRDDRHIQKMDLSPFKGKILTFGLHQRAHYRGSDLRYEQIGMSFTLHHKKANYKVYVPGLGEHQVMNALGALAVVHQLGMDLTQAITYLGLFKPVRSHTALFKGIHDSLIIDDTWSSNPTSLQAALEVLKAKGKDKQKILVFGKIAYLGEKTKLYYDQVARMCVDYDIDTLITVDGEAKLIGDKTIQYGLAPNQVIHCSDKGEIQKRLEKELHKDAIVLFKISMLDGGYDVVIDNLKQKALPLG